MLVQCACYIKGTENVFWKSVLNSQEGQVNDRWVSLTENLCALLNYTGTFLVMGEGPSKTPQSHFPRHSLGIRILATSQGSR